MLRLYIVDAAHLASTGQWRRAFGHTPGEICSRTHRTPHNDLKQGNGALPERDRLGPPKQNSSHHIQAEWSEARKSPSLPLGA
jgi:hypothetical protein